MNLLQRIKQARFCVYLLVLTLFLGPLLNTRQVLAKELAIPHKFVLGNSDLIGLKVDSSKPFAFQFIVKSQNSDEEYLRKESSRFIEYFLTALTVPSEDIWVNLAPGESDRVLPSEIVKTQLGNDILDLDYQLKQSAAALTHPETETGAKYWNAVHRLGLSEVPLNKIWIEPGKAQILVDGLQAFVSESYLQLKVADHANGSEAELQIVRNYVLPELSKIVNESDDFLKVRQIHHAILLASWYKYTLKNSILNKIYSNKSKVAGIDLGDPMLKDAIYDRYLDSFKNGVYDYVRKEINAGGRLHKRRYFSGGILGTSSSLKNAVENTKPLRGSLFEKSVLSSSIDKLPLNLVDFSLEETSSPRPTVARLYREEEEIKEIFSSESLFRRFMALHVGHDKAVVASEFRDIDWIDGFTDIDTQYAGVSSQKALTYEWLFNHASTYCDWLEELVSQDQQYLDKLLNYKSKIGTIVINKICDMNGLVMGFMLAEEDYRERNKNIVLQQRFRRTMNKLLRHVDPDLSDNELERQLVKHETYIDYESEHWINNSVNRAQRAIAEGKEVVFVFGHANPDGDSKVGAAELARFKSLVYRNANPNVTFIPVYLDDKLDDYDITILGPELTHYSEVPFLHKFKDFLANNIGKCSWVLVDHNDPHESYKAIKKLDIPGFTYDMYVEKILDIVDHHPYSPNSKVIDNAAKTIYKSGSVAAMVAQRFMGTGLIPGNNAAGRLHNAALRDTEGRTAKLRKRDEVIMDSLAAIRIHNPERRAIQRYERNKYSDIMNKYVQQRDMKVVANRDYKIIADTYIFAVDETFSGIFTNEGQLENSARYKTLIEEHENQLKNYDLPFAYVKVVTYDRDNITVNNERNVIILNPNYLHYFDNVMNEDFEDENIKKMKPEIISRQEFIDNIFGTIIDDVYKKYNRRVSISYNGLTDEAIKKRENTVESFEVLTYEELKKQREKKKTLEILKSIDDGDIGLNDVAYYEFGLLSSIGGHEQRKTINDELMPLIDASVYLKMVLRDYRVAKAKAEEKIKAAQAAGLKTRRVHNSFQSKKKGLSSALVRGGITYGNLNYDVAGNNVLIDSVEIDLDIDVMGFTYRIDHIQKYIHQ